MRLRHLLITWWENNNGARWLEEGPGDCLSPFHADNPDLMEAAAPYSVTYVIKPLILGKEEWRYVEACGYVIVPPFRVNS
jgi:hypothetical protein